MPFQNIKQQFPIFQNNPGLIFLDTAASAQKPQCVINAISHFYANDYANVHRGSYELSDRADKKFEDARKTVANFIGAKSPKEIVFTKNATESFNLLSYSILEQGLLHKGDKIVLTISEHHANHIPWQMLANKTGAELVFIHFDETKNLDLEQIKTVLDTDVKIFALSFVSNVLGTINPVQEICKYAQEHNILTIVDGSQSVAHMPTNVQELDCDFFAFSSHKMYGPSGVGVLYGKYEKLNALPPFLMGGGTIDGVELCSASFKEAPYKFEAGTPAIAEAVGLAEACRFLEKQGLKKIAQHDQKISAYAYSQLSQIPEITIYSHKDACGLISFEVKNIRAYDLGDELSDANICLRIGKHCAHPLLTHLESGLLLRASFGIYTDTQDIDTFIKTLKAAIGSLR